MRVRCLGSTVSHAGSRIPHFLRSVFWGPQVWLKHAQYSHGFQLACAIREQINIRHAVRGQVERILSGVRRLVGVRSMLQQDPNDVGGTITGGHHQRRLTARHRCIHVGAVFSSAATD
jgi:hypothetical protein